MKKINLGNLFAMAWEIYSNNFIILSLGFILAIAISSTVLLMPVGFAGFTFMLLKSAQGEDVELKDIFHGFTDFKRYFLGGLLFFLVLFTGCLTCLGGLIPACALLFFMPVFMVEKGYMGGIALGECWEFFKEQWLLSIILVLITIFILVAGLFLFVIGIVVLGPFAFALRIAAYDQFFGVVKPYKRRFSEDL